MQTMHFNYGSNEQQTINAFVCFLVYLFKLLLLFRLYSISILFFILTNPIFPFNYLLQLTTSNNESNVHENTCAMRNNLKGI